MSGVALRMRALRKFDKDGNEYFFTRPNAPFSVDLSQCVIFVHPLEEDADGNCEADIVIKRYYPRKKNQDVNG